LKKESFYILDKCYIDFGRLYRIRLAGAFFITGARDNMNYKRLYSRAADRKNGVLCDQTIKLNNHYAQKDYPEKLRRIKFRGEETGKVLVYLISNFTSKQQMSRNSISIAGKLSCSLNPDFAVGVIL
jgi:hypothetical protein